MNNKAPHEKKTHEGETKFTRRSALGGSVALGSGLFSTLGVSAALAQNLRFSSSRSDVVNTTSGQVQGLRWPGGAQAYYGVPYGATTAGSGRFKRASKPTPWTGIRDCVEVSQRCPQAPSGPNGPTVEVFSLDRKEPMGEDLLSINIFTPASSGKRPVMVWLHGGGYSSGSAGWLLYDGSNLAVSKDVVVVGVNHRLNVFGHLSLAELGGEEYADSGNVGILDIVDVLLWVKENISNFGGDPECVTLFGQSGGAGKVSNLMAFAEAKGLFHRAIAMSGSSLTAVRPDIAAENTERFLTSLGLGKSDWHRLVTDFSWQQLLEAYISTPGLTTAPVIDGRNLLRDPFSPDAPSESSMVPMMMGSTEHEINFFPTTPLLEISDEELISQVATALRSDHVVAEERVALYRQGRPDRSAVELLQIILSDHTMRRGIVTQAERKSAQSDTWLYYFTWQSPVRDGLLRAYHCLDIPFVFNNVDVCSAMVGAGQNRYALAEVMSSAFTHFARTGNPNGDGVPRWDRFNISERATLMMNDNPAQILDPYSAERQATMG